MGLNIVDADADVCGEKAGSSVVDVDVRFVEEGEEGEVRPLCPGDPV